MSGTLHPCLDCGRLVQGQRCLACRWRHDRERPTVCACRHPRPEHLTMWGCDQCDRCGRLIVKELTPA